MSCPRAATSGEFGDGGYRAAARLLQQLALWELNTNNATHINTIQVLDKFFGKFHHSLETHVAHYLSTDTPAHWPARAKATVLVLLYEMACPLVEDYFRTLRANAQSFSLAEILAEIL
jgi:hypothetical protein